MLNTVWPFWASWASEVPAETVIAVAAITKIKILCIFFLDTLDHASSCRIQWLCNRFPSQVSYSMYWGSTMKSACFTHTPRSDLLLGLCFRRAGPTNVSKIHQKKTTGERNFGALPDFWKFDPAGD